MSKWIYGRPSGRSGRAIVYVDADNLLIQDNCPYTPNFSIAMALDQVVTFSRQIADDPGVYAFVDMQREHPNAARRELAVECDRRGIRVVHVPSTGSNKDQVDTAIINEWYSQHRNLPLDMPFILISLDKDFIEMLQSTKRDGRPIYIGMPTHHLFPPHVLDFQGAGWLDPLANQHQAMSFLLNEEGTRADPGFEIKFERHYPKYRDWQRAFTELARTMLEQPNRAFEDSVGLIDFLTATWQQLGCSADDATLALPYLIIYQVMQKREGLWSANLNHMLFRSAPTPSGT